MKKMMLSQREKNAMKAGAPAGVVVKMIIRRLGVRLATAVAIYREGKG